jgi:uncharacterized protein YqcC (DUF446 family)
MAFSILFFVAFAACGAWQQWIYWTRMYPLMEQRGAVPKKPLWAPLWPYKRICIAENRPLTSWDQFWISTWCLILLWMLGILCLIVTDHA